MNVTCPQCSTVFRVDPAKVPEQGVRARCSVCSGLIAVRRPAVAVPALVPHAPAVRPPALPTPQSAAATPAPEPPRHQVPPAPEPSQHHVPPPPPPAVDAVPHRAAAAPAPRPAPPRVPGPEPAAPTRQAPPPVEAAPVAAAPASPPPRFNNPFLQQDPSTRARRLARALVSDLVVYYPEKRQRGLAEGNLKELFGEEIRKSWEEYSEQVGEDIASTTPYFTEALNEILAEGRSLFG
jgi:predicted Zn finger-like uncharacterized protein